MGYKLLGMVAWKGRSWILGRLFPGTKRPLIAGGVLLVIAGIVLGARRRGAGD